MSGRRDAGKCNVILRVTVTVPPPPPPEGMASRRSNNRGGWTGGMECRVHAMEVQEKK